MCVLSINHEDGLLTSGVLGRLVINSCTVSPPVRRFITPVPQDVVMMCQAIEKLFEQKILAMPKEVGVNCSLISGVCEIHISLLLTGD